MNRKIQESLQVQLLPFRYSVNETSYLGLKPGDLIQFSYSGSIRQGLIVSSKRTSDGMFLSTRNNTLLNVVVTSSLSEAMFSLMVNNLYRNETACNYHSSRIIGAFLGNNNFRTFNVSKLRDILKLNIQK